METMRKLVLSMMVSIDGYIEDQQHSLEWFAWDEEMERYMLNFLRGFDLFIYGRKSYEILAEYWPEADAAPAWPDRDPEFAFRMNETPKLILTSSAGELAWNAKRFGADPANELRQLKMREGQNIALFAGASAASYFIREGLVDEYHLIVNPAVLGGGTPLFRGDERPGRLRLLSSRSFPSGIVILHYAT
jgi:Dihydrofolate reductase